jgi:hypothetical protein
MQKLPVTLNENQAQRLAKKKIVQIKHEQLQPPHAHHILLHREAHARAVKALSKGTGLRIGPLTDEELEGSGFWDLLKKAASTVATAAVNTGRFIKKNIIDSDLYKNEIKKQIVRPLVDKAEAAITTVAGPTIGNLSKVAIDKLGDVTGGYGVIEIPPKKKIKTTPTTTTTKPKPKAKAKGGSFVIA